MRGYYLITIRAKVLILSHIRKRQDNSESHARTPRYDDDDFLGLSFEVNFLYF